MTTEKAIEWMTETLYGAGVTGDRELIDVCTLAINAIRAQQQAQKNDPLTLEELREMDGEPVFCVDKVIPKRSAWGIVCIRNEIPFIRTFQDGGRFSTFFYFGKLNFDWLAYRHKLEEITK